MEAFIPSKKKTPEQTIQQAIIRRLKQEGWFVKSTHGSLYQAGFPDLFACKKTMGHRWIEVKLPDMKGSKFTAAQLKTFPLLCNNGSGVWVLTDATEAEFEKLKHRPNWHVKLLMHG